MSRKLKIRDLTLRDGQQSLLATRMNQSQVDKVLPFYKDAGFYAMEVWGGAVPDSVMRFLGESPWTRLETIKAAVGDTSLLTALSRGRNLFGYSPYPDDIIEGFCRNSIESGLGIMRIFDALNDINNVKSTIASVKKYGGIADCAICYTIDPKEEPKKKGLFSFLKKAEEPKKVFTDQYFLDKAKQMAELGADMVTIKDMSGLIPPKRVYGLVKLLKENLGIPVDFHTHCTPGYGLASVFTAIVAGADIVDTNMWNFSGGSAAPSFEFIYIFCKKLGIEIDVDIKAAEKINAGLEGIRRELSQYDATKMFPKPIYPLEELPSEVDALFGKIVEAAEAVDQERLLDLCHELEQWYGFPKPNEIVKNAEVPGGMYSNMLAQLKALKSEDILDEAMALIPTVRRAAGLIPLVTPTSQIVGAQSVNCALSMKKGQPMYSNCSNQFVALVKGQYGTTPVPVDPQFRKQITGSPEEVPYDVSTYARQENPVLEEFGGVKLAADEKQFLLLELFPQVARDYLTKLRKDEWDAKRSAEAAEAAEAEAAAAKDKEEAFLPVVGKLVNAPLPGRILSIDVKVGDKVDRNGDVLVLEAMKMENTITSDYAGTVRQIFVNVGDAVAADQRLVEIE